MDILTLSILITVGIIFFIYEIRLHVKGQMVEKAFHELEIAHENYADLQNMIGDLADAVSEIVDEETETKIGKEFSRLTRLRWDELKDTPRWETDLNDEF